MKNGDISNQTPPRILVNLDTILKKTVASKKFLGLFNQHQVITEYDVLTLNNLWRYRDKAFVTLELFVATYDQEYEDDVMDQVENDIDQYGTNPFSYFTTWRTFKDVLTILPYRNDIAGVIDPPRAWSYGSKALDMNRLI